jgi:hypothetical protein
MFNSVKWSRLTILQLKVQSQYQVNVKDAKIQSGRPKMQRKYQSMT